MNEKKNSQLACFIMTTLFVLVGIGSSISAATASNRVDVSMKGQLLDLPPCAVYGVEGIDAPIRIGFNEVAIQRIDGQHYRQDFTLTVSCEGTLGQNVPIELGYNGRVSGFDTSALQASQALLGVRLYQADDGTVVTPNSRQTLTMSSNGRRQLPLYAVPVKAEGGRLIEGKFTASATLALTYP
nr:fimbrial protein [uncultured Moellerella sp.]